MLCLRDPADPENDLGRKGASIKHVQVTCMHLMNMAHDMLQGPLDNAQQSSSLLQHIVGPAYSTAKPPREADPRVQKLYEHSLRRIEALRWLRAKKSIISPQPPKKGVITYWSLDADRKVEKTESEQTETTTGIIMRKIAKNGDLTPAEKIQAEKIAAVKLAKKDDSKPTENGETTAGNDEPAPFKIRKIAHEPLPFKIRKKVPNRAVSESESSTFDQSRTARKAEGGSEDEG